MVAVAEGAILIRKYGCDKLSFLFISKTVLEEVKDVTLIGFKDNIKDGDKL